MKTEYESAFSVPRSSIVMGSSTSPLPCFQKLKTLLLTCFTCFKNWKNAAYRCTCLHALENCCLHALKIWTLSTISAPVHQEVKLRKETESAKNLRFRKFDGLTTDKRYIPEREYGFSDWKKRTVPLKEEISRLPTPSFRFENPH